MRTKGIINAILVAALAGGCTVGPDYHQPHTAAPAHWSTPLAGGEKNGQPELVDWWKQFNDPELNSLVERAVRSNLDLRMAGARVREARAQYSIAYSALLPTGNSSISYQRELTSEHQPVIGSIPLPPGVPFENNVYQAGLDASWEIDVFGGRRRGVESAKAGVAASEYGRGATILSLLGDVAFNYVEVRGYQRRLVIANENIDAQSKTLDITRDRYEKGLTSDLDVQQASTQLSTTKSEVPGLQSSLDAAIHRLGVLLGQEPGSLLAELNKSAPIPSTPPVVPVGLPSELLLRRPDVRQAERELAAATANIGVAKSDLFPKFSLTGSAGFQSISANDWFTAGSRFWSVGPTMEWRIFDAARIRGNIRLQNARQEEALASYEQSMLRAFEDVENGLVFYANEQTRRRSLEDAVTSSRKSLDLANQLYANGLTDFLRVLDAERSLYQAQDSLVQSDRTVSVNLISLYKSLGGGWEGVAKQTSPALAQADAPVVK